MNESPTDLQPSKRVRDLPRDIEHGILARILSASNDACWCMDFGNPVDLTAPDHEVVRQVFENDPFWRFANPAMSQLYLLDPAEALTSRPVHEIFPRNRQNEEFVLNLLANGFEVDAAPALDRRYDGVEIYVENDVRAHVEAGRLIRMFGIVRDVGKHRRREIALRQRLDAALSLVSAVDLPLIALSPDCRVEAVNLATADLLQRQMDDCLGQSVTELLLATADSAAADQWVRALLAADGTTTLADAAGTEWSVSSRPGGGVILGRHRPGQAALDTVILRGVETLRHHHEPARDGSDAVNVRFLSANRTRPDFSTQRRISPALHQVLSRGERAVREGMRILITGESGVGKSEVARFLHGGVADARDPFIVMNCASSSDARFEEALFGREAGPEGDARPGLLEQAEGGTLFLDEVGEIPLSAQAKLLGFLEDGLAMRVGGVQGRLANVRVIAATNSDLRQMVRAGRFRADLYFRLAVIVLTVPPLRDMPALIGHLTDRFLQTFNQRRQTPTILPARYRDLLEDYSFPGNIRELLNMVQRTVIFVDDAESIQAIFADLLAPMDIPGNHGDNAMPAGAMFDLKSELRRHESALIDKAIRIHGSKRKAAKALGVNIGTIVRKTAEPSEPAAAEPTTNKRGSRT